MQSIVPLACFFSLIRPPGVRFESGLLQIVPVNKAKCPFVKGHTDIGFQLYTRHNPTVFQPLMLGDDEKLFASNIDFHAPTVLYFGAFLEQPDDGSGVMVREAYMLRGDTNVIMIDSRTLEAGPWYFTAAENTWYIGNFAAQFVDYLVSRGLNLTNTHFVGHSLGAQAAGVAGSALKSGRVSRITGLDPAFPLFDKLPLEQRLDPSDAEFVDVIHTDAGIFGFNRPIGHVDFYPNGGISPQPGCELEVVLHQQHLTNKCDGRTQQPNGFYTFYLQPNDKKDFKTKLYEFFTHIQTLKDTDVQSNTVSKIRTVRDTSDKVAKRYKEDAKDSKTKVKITKINNFELKSRDFLVKLTRRHDVVDEDGSNIKEENGQMTNNEDINNKNETDSAITESNGEIDTIDINDDKSEHQNHASKTSQKEDGASSTTTEHNIDLDEINISDDKTDKNNKHNTEKSQKDRKRVKTVKRERKRSGIFGNESTQTVSKQIENTVSIIERLRKKRQRRFIFNRESEAEANDNAIMRMIKFLFKHQKNILPVVTVMREIDTIINSNNGKLQHNFKEKENYFGTQKVLPSIATYTLELGAENKVVAFVKKLLGLAPKGDKLTIAGGK